jgi:hypothetical protein
MRFECLKQLLTPGAGTRWAAAAAALVAAAFTGSYSPEAQATAAFARQTGMSCFACHTRPPSMTAIGKRFFLQGYRTPNIRQMIEHGEPGAQGGRLNISLDELQWWRIRSSPAMKRDGRLDVDPANRDKWFSTLVQRFSWGVAGPIGDYVSIWNEIYYQPYDDDPDRFVPGGAGPTANSRGNWRDSTVEVDELEIVFGMELPMLNPGNYFGFNLSDRGYRKVQNRGGTGIHGTISGADGDAGGVGIFGFWDDKYYVNLHLLPGSSVNWDKKDMQLNLGWWPRNSQQDDLYMDLLFTETRDSSPTASRTAFGTTNVKSKGRAVDFRVQYIKADWGMHTIDSEWGIGAVKDTNNVGLPSANEFEGVRTSGGVRYWYNRHYGAEVLFTKWLKYEETSSVSGETIEWTRPPIQWAYGLMYQVAANVLWTFEVRQSQGNPIRPGQAEPNRFRTLELKLEIGF